MKWVILSLVVGIGLMGGCTLAPKDERPVAPIAPRWNIATNTLSTASAQPFDHHWTNFFDEPRLQRIISIALDNNRDLRIASLRIQQMQAEYRIRRSDLFPAVEGNANLNRQRTSGTISDFNGGTLMTTYAVSLGASYELDFFGRIRSLKKSALERYLATEEARNSVQISLISEIATEYLNQMRLREAKAIAGRTLSAVETSLQLIRRRYEVGAASELELRTAEGQVQSVKVNSASFLQQLAESENALVLLMGQPLPQDLPMGRPFAEQRLLSPLPAGLPSDVLQRRPDIQSAEHTLRAANADIGAARAAFFPQFLLTGSGGFASANLDELFTGPSKTWSITPELNVPVFNMGANRARLSAAKVGKEIEVAQYQKAIQTAFREVADALAAHAILADKLRAQELLTTAQQRRFELTEARYDRGVDSYVEVLLAQQDLYAAQQNLVQFQAARLLNSIALFRSLGGGWNEP